MAKFRSHGDGRVLIVLAERGIGFMQVPTPAGFRMAAGHAPGPGRPAQARDQGGRGARQNLHRTLPLAGPRRHPGPDGARRGLVRATDPDGKSDGSRCGSADLKHRALSSCSRSRRSACTGSSSAAGASNNKYSLLGACCTRRPTVSYRGPDEPRAGPEISCSLSLVEISAPADQRPTSWLGGP